MNEKLFLDCFRQAIGLRPEDELSLVTILDSSPWWDSLSVISTISMLSTEFGVRATAKEVSQCLTIAELKRIADRGSSSNS